MLWPKIKSIANFFEDPNHPLMGPNLKCFYLIGILPIKSVFQKYLFMLFYIIWFSVLVGQLIGLYILRNDFNSLLNNLAVILLSFVCETKAILTKLNQKKWKEIIDLISYEENKEIKAMNHVTAEIMKNYKKYARILFYSYSVLSFMTGLMLCLIPYLKYFSSEDYRYEIKVGEKPYPEVLTTWSPFDNSKMPVYLTLSIIHVISIMFGAAVIAFFDTNAISIMIFLRGQMCVLKHKCQNIFDDNINTIDAIKRIKECHRHHSSLMKIYKFFDSILSPILFIYVLVCSITICFCVIQFVSEHATVSDKLWVIQFATALILQLFVYCWHSNDVMVETQTLHHGVYFSNWWKADVRLQKYTLLLAGKLSRTIVLHAGPFTVLSTATFIDILKGTYSFFTLFSQMQD